jgi:hypothetical protein
VRPLSWSSTFVSTAFAPCVNPSEKLTAKLRLFVAFQTRVHASGERRQASELER